MNDRPLDHILVHDCAYDESCTTCDHSILRETVRGDDRNLVLECIMGNDVRHTCAYYTKRTGSGTRVHVHMDGGTVLDMTWKQGIDIISAMNQGCAVCKVGDMYVATAHILYITTVRADDIGDGEE